MTAQIVMDAGGGPVIGSITLDAVDVGLPVLMSNFDNTGVSGWRWDIVDTPEPSLTLNPLPPPEFLSTRTIANDVAGHTVVVRLTTYLDVARTIIDAVDQKVIGVRFPPPFDWIIPGASQTIERDLLRGWASDVNRMLRELHAFVSSGGASGFTLIPSGAVQEVPPDKQLLLRETARVEGQFVVRGQVVLLKGPNHRRVLDPILATQAAAVPNNSLVPVDPTAAPMSIMLPNRGTPGESVQVKNDSDSLNQIKVLAGGYPIDDENEFLMSSAREVQEFTRQRNQTWSVMI